jgi:hypothetical protein
MLLDLYIVTSLLAMGGCGNHGTFQSQTFHLVKPAYLSMKEGSLFCFVCHAEISQTTVLHATLLVSLESSQWVGVHWLGLRLFGAMVWKLLIIELFSQWKLNKMKTENWIGIWGSSWCRWKVLGQSDLIEFISQFLELRCGRYWFLSEFGCWKFEQIAKFGFGSKIQCWALNVFTLGPTAQATLFGIETTCRCHLNWGLLNCWRAT